MRSLLGATAVVLLASPLGVHAADVRLGTCEASVGAWEFASKEGGRAVIARGGDRYHVMWVTTFVDSQGVTQPEGIAAECTCRDAPTRLAWKCRVAFSFDSSLVGAEQTYEWAVDGGTLNSWYVAPDGTRSATPLRRPK
jgi:hypothetical protein